MSVTSGKLEASDDDMVGKMLMTTEFHFDENFLEHNNTNVKVGAEGAGGGGGKRKQKDIFISSLLNNTRVERAERENQNVSPQQQPQGNQDVEQQLELPYVLDSCDKNKCNNNNSNHHLTNTISTPSSLGSSSPQTTTTTSPLSTSPPPTLITASLDKIEKPKAMVGEEPDNEDEDFEQPLSERWSPLGANYDDGALSPTSDLRSPVSEMELLSSVDSQLDKHELAGDVVGAALEQTRLRNMEEEQELLTSSLMALTSHFAHVQLRVRQIVEAPSHERDQLLKDLEEFAFRGIPEPLTGAELQGDVADDQPEAHQRQCELIEQLKTQLSDLEKMAYEAGAPVLPQHILLEKQKVIIDELKSKLNLKVDDHDLPELSAEELKSQVDSAIGEFVGPLRMKEQLVAQLKTQITDLERFIAFLQCDADDPKAKTLQGGEKFNEAYNSYAAKKKGSASASSSVGKRKSTVGGGPTEESHSLSSPNPREPDSADTNGRQMRESLNSKAHGLIDKASLLMQMFATTHFGNRAEQFQKNTLKKTTKGNHWGDLRAQLEVDIQEVASLAATLSFDREKLANMRRALKKPPTAKTASEPKVTTGNGALTTVPPRGRGRRGHPSSMNYNELKPYTVSSDSDDEDDDDPYEYFSMRHKGGDSISTISKELTAAVRKNFSMTLLALMQHGLRIETESATSSLIVPFMRCLNPSPVFAAEHSYRERDFAPASYMPPSHYTGAADDDDARAGLFGGGSRPMHAWELILEYYYLKHGDEYNNTPARKLSESFNLHMVDTGTVTVKQNLLSAIGMIIAMHRPYKRSCNAHFKAFVCAGLNSHQLVEWLSLIFSCGDLIETYYTPNSYVVHTGFRDSLRSIDALTKYDFDLPVDLAIRHFRNI